MTTTEPITVREAKRQGMIPLTLPMDPADTVLHSIQQDMSSRFGTTWANVRAPMGRIEIWRRPHPSTIFTQTNRRHSTR